ncbi:MAG: hypothetical protein GY803_14785, partial [Chloroflexi bacterium]|nr:hypothetical protein [Chloroflexota bacterium]
AFYPYALFSPELQAVKYAQSQQIPVYFMDLPQSNQLATETRPQMPDAELFRHLAMAAGHKGYESWWNVLVEQRRDSAELFAGVLEMMTAVRTASPAPNPDDPSAKMAEQREASMRQAIRRAYADGYERIAVVVGAWHGPALVNLDGAAVDEAILADLPTVKVEAAWVPWTYGRLSYTTGYGAGILSPGWYHHLWQMGDVGADATQSSIQWLTQVANLLRDEGLDASSAHIIEAVRLAEALAAMRGLPFPGLPELKEATQTVLCFGDAEPMQLIERKLIVSERMGAVPPDTPMVPLQRDLRRQQKRLRLRPEPSPSILNLDLRIENHLERSHLLHRLGLLGIPWGQPTRARSGEGTYREVWKLQWRPDFAIQVIEASVWGNTAADATAAFAQDAADNAPDLPALTKLLDRIILAELPDVIQHLMTRIEERAALSSDIPHLMEALPPLARVLRYGSVRQTDKGMIRHVVDGLLTRICIGLPSTCASMDDAAAAEMEERVTAVHDVVRTLHEEEHTGRWHETLAKLADQNGLHGLLAGRAVRLLLDADYLTRDEALLRMERTLSARVIGGQEFEQLTQMAAWLEGFLKGTGLLVLHDQALWQLLDSWLTHLDGARFEDILPLLRRTFASFNENVRQQLLERARLGTAVVVGDTAVVEFDYERADTALPLIRQLLGVWNEDN